jgi:hypothetical protein
MKHQDRFKKKYKIDAIDFVEKADLEFFGVAKTVGIQSILKSYAEKKEMNIEFNDEFNKELVEAFAEAGKKFPYNEKITFKKEIYQLEPTPVNPPIPKSKGVLEDFKDIVSKDVFRENLSAIYVSDDGFLYGTDAHKLIRYKNNDYSEYDGKLINLKLFIDSKGKKLDFVDAKPLQYESVIPKDNPNIVKNLPTYNFYNFSKSVIALKKLLSSDIFNVIFDFKGESFGFNPILMSDVFHFALCKGFDTFTLEYSTPNRAIIFNFKDNSLGLLMPIMVKEDSLMGTTKTTIEQVVSDYGYSKTMPKTKTEKTTKVEVKEVPYKKFEGSVNQTVYVPRRDISYVVLRNGEKLSGNDIIDGVYKIKKMAHGGGVGNENAEMVMNYNKQIAHHTKEMNEAMSKKGEVPAWVVAKMTRSASDLSDATHYMEGKGEEFAKGGTIGNNVHIMDEKSLMNNKSGVIIGDEGTFWLVKTLNGTGLVKKSKVKIIEEMEKGGGVGKKEMILYIIETLSDGNKDVLTDKENNLYIYEKGVLYDTKDGNKKGSSHRMSKINLTILPYKEYETGGGVGDKIAEIKAKIEKAKNNSIMPENLKKQYIEKYEKELAELEPKVDNNDIGFETIMKKTLVSPKGSEVTLRVTYYPDNKNLKYRIYLAGNPEKAFTNKSEMEESYNKILESYKKKNYTIKSSETETYKLGDMWSNDFDYEGMVKYGLKVDENTKLETLRKLFDSFEDVNYHTVSKPLWNAIGMLKEGKKDEAKKLIREFHNLCIEELKEMGVEVEPKMETKETSKVSKKYDYIPQRDIEQIKAKQGTIENKDILDGAYVKKGWKHKK